MPSQIRIKYVMYISYVMYRTLSMLFLNSMAPSKNNLRAYLVLIDLESSRNLSISPATNASFLARVQRLI